MADIYLDNAATTFVDPLVMEAMLPYMTHLYGNPSSLHRYGSQARAAIERARKKIATLLQVAPVEIVFTSGGTEGNNMLLRGVVEAMGIENVLTSPLEHFSVGRPLVHLAEQGKVVLSYVAIDPKGSIIWDDLETWLKHHPHALVSLMQVNHEVGNITDMATVGKLCQTYGALLHSDMVQGMYCMPNDGLIPHLVVGSAHKIHGPKGIGFGYIASHVGVAPLISGGSQELNRRAGTENVAAIVGMAKALEIACEDRTQIVNHLVAIKQHMVTLLKKRFPRIIFNGYSESVTQSSPTILNISLPDCRGSDMLIYNLSIQGVAASAGSACTSGSQLPSPVVAALQQAPSHALRFSFSKYTTYEEVDKTVEILVHLGKAQ